MARCLTLSSHSSSVKVPICHSVFKIVYSVMLILVLPASLHLFTLLTNCQKLFHASLLFWWEWPFFLALISRCQLFILKFNSNHYHFLPELKSLFLWSHRFSNTFLNLFCNIFIYMSWMLYAYSVVFFPPTPYTVNSCGQGLCFPSLIIPGT